MRIRITFFLLLVTCFVNAQTTVVDSIYIGGMYRQYRLYIPAIYNASNPVPLIFNLHGYTSNNAAQEMYADFRPIADTANFILVHPNGTYDMYNYRYWNCFTPIGTSPNDLNFLNALIDSVSAQYSIDAGRIYSTGISNGGFMSTDLACYLGNRITAISSVAAGMSSLHKSGCNPPHPMPVMEIHGTADATVPYAGASGMEPVDTVIKFWVGKNSCSTNPIVTTVPNINTADGCTADNYLYNSGSMGSTVELYKITNGGHTWPGAIPITSLGNTNEDFSGVKEIWRFFRKYKMSDLVAIRNFEAEKFSVDMFPNPASSVVHVRGNMLSGVELINNLGQRVVSKKLADEADVQLDLSHLSKGIYLIRVWSGAKYATKALIID